MNFIIKCAPFEVSVGGRAIVEVKRFAGADPKAGDRMFFWFSESAGGHGLAGFGRVTAVSDDDPIDIALSPEQGPPLHPLAKADLAPYRDSDDEAPVASLARKLFRHALNKVAELSPDESDYLSAHWPRPTQRRYEPLERWLSNRRDSELILSFGAIEEILSAPLPKGAQRPQWWANTVDAHTNVQREAWRTAGYDAFLLKDREEVRFVRKASADPLIAGGGDAA